MTEIPGLASSSRQTVWCSFRSRAPRVGRPAAPKPACRRAEDAGIPAARAIARRSIWTHGLLASTAVDTTAASPTRRCVLIVEANDEVALFMQEALEDRDYNVAVVSSAVQARRAIQANAFSLVILDWRLIEANHGLQAGNARQAQPPAILATGGFQGNEADLQRLCPGELAILPKPFGLKTLLLAVTSVLALAQKPRT